MALTQRVLLQAGHSQVFPPFPGDGTGGAPGEAAWTSQLAPLIAAYLRPAGVNVTIVGAWLTAAGQLPPPAEALADYDLFLSLHYDALLPTIPGYDTGCLIGRAALDPCGDRADAFIGHWQEVYPAATSIPLHQERLNPNITDYYAFRDTSPNTPGVLIEHGVGNGLDHDYLFGQVAKVAELDAQIILEHLTMTDEERTALLAQLAVLQADRDKNYRVKMAFETVLRDLERKHRLKRGFTDKLIQGTP